MPGAAARSLLKTVHWTRKDFALRRDQGFPVALDLRPEIYINKLSTHNRVTKVYKKEKYKNGALCFGRGPWGFGSQFD